MGLINVVRNALNPVYRREMIHKVGLRFREPSNLAEAAAVAAWCDAHAVPASEWAQSIDAAIWQEASDFALAQRALGQERLAELGLDLGGGGAYDLLYFFVRVLKPELVVETGVAAGFSSRAFLSALAKNGTGRLFSSDFPYFRLPNPEQYIGYLVEQPLRAGWSLFKDGDRINLPAIARDVDGIDLFHYDSDKTVAGRRFAVETLKTRLRDDALVVFDDIQDNWHFRDFVADGRPHRIFAFEGKWIGMTGGPASFYD